MSDVPKKNSKLLIVGLIAVVIVVIIVAIAGVFAMGSACCLGSMIFSSTDPTLVEGDDMVTLFDESQQIPEGDFIYYEIPAEAGETLDIKVNTDGPAIDVMIMDSEQFDEYQDALQGLNDGTLYTIDTETSVVSKTISYTADEYDIYYVVFDNTENPADGVEAGRDVNVNIVIDSIL